MRKKKTSTDANILGGVRQNIATVEQEQCITKKEKKKRKTKNYSWK